MLKYFYVYLRKFILYLSKQPIKVDPLRVTPVLKIYTKLGYQCFWWATGTVILAKYACESDHML